MNEQQLFYGDNLDVMRKNIADETVDLCYIDPPFNSKRNYNQIYNNIGKEDKAQSMAFVDTWEWNARAEKEYDEICVNENGIFTAQTSDLIMGLYKILGRGSLLSYLISMTLRINEIHRVLKPTGSLYLHCDPTASHYLKIVLDAIFCGQGGEFKNEIEWKRTTSSSSKAVAKRFGSNHDTIFYYVKSNKAMFNSIFTDYPEKEIEKRFKRSDERGHYKDAELATYSQETFERLKSENKLIITETGKYRYKIYLDEIKGVLVDDIWIDIPPINAMAKERLGYPTQKPEALLERIIKASSNEGDVVLDAYCGCGTTVAVAQKLNRKWIGIDISYQSISLILKRLTEAHGVEIIKHIDISGIPRDIESARALALKKDDRLRKEFEKWAVLTYSENRAMINDKKGKDYGIDGRARIREGSEQYRDMLFSVKSGNVNSAMIRDFRGTIEREKAAAGIFITLKEPTRDMKQEAAAAGFYSNEYMRDIEKIKIVTINQILKGERLNIPLAVDVLKKAEAADSDNQLTLF